MPYRFAINDQDYSDFSAGRVFYSQPGAPAFPVRLASEIFQRALELQKPTAPLVLYDPTCGGAYHLTALGFLHGNMIHSIFASDNDPQALELARRNLGLLTPAGLNQREQEIRRMYSDFGKESHAAALRSLAVLRETQDGMVAPAAVQVFPANVFEPDALQRALSATDLDLIFSDIPYGNMSGWQMPAQVAAQSQTPIWHMLDSLRAVLSPHTLLAIASDKNQKIMHEAYRRVERFQVGKRQVVFLRPEAQASQAVPQ